MFSSYQVTTFEFHENIILYSSFENPVGKNFWFSLDIIKIYIVNILLCLLNKYSFYSNFYVISN